MASLRTAYRRGVAFERAVQKALTTPTSCVIRSAGSHSPVDLVWMDRAFPHPCGIQCKVGPMTQAARRGFMGWCCNRGMLPILAMKIRGGFRLQLVGLGGTVRDVAREDLCA